MYELLAKVAASFGILLSSKIITFIADELSLEDKRKIEDNNRKYSSLKEESEIKRSEKISELSEKYSADIKKVIDEESFTEENISEYIPSLEEELKPHIVSIMKDSVAERIDYADNLMRDIDSAIKILNSEKKVKYNSSLRYNAFRMLHNEFEEAKNKAKAYRYYLQRYKKIIPDIYDVCDKKEDLWVSYTLPKKYPYKNKVFILDSDSFDNDTGIGRTVLHGCMNIDFFITDYDFYKKQLSEKFIVMMLDFDNENRRNNYSIQHGRYKQIEKSGGFTGVTAKVFGYSNRDITLVYGNDMKLTLRAKNLYNFNRYPAIGSEIIVYPIGDSYSWKEKRTIYYVSQRQEDAQISLDFKKLPMIVAVNKLPDFAKYIQNNNIDFNISYDDVKIAPVSTEDDDILNPKELIIKFGEYFTLLVEIKLNDKKLYLTFKDFINAKHLTAEDIFIPFNSEIDVLWSLDFDKYLHDEHNEEVFDNMNNLVLTVYKEFKLQHTLKNSQSGMRYFSAWENITSALKKYVEKSNPLELETDGIPEQISVKEKGIILEVKVLNPPILRKHYGNILQKG